MEYADILSSDTSTHEAMIAATLHAETEILGNYAQDDLGLEPDFVQNHAKGNGLNYGPHQNGHGSSSCRTKRPSVA